MPGFALAAVQAAVQVTPDGRLTVREQQFFWLKTKGREFFLRSGVDGRSSCHSLEVCVGCPVGLGFYMGGCFGAFDVMDRSSLTHAALLCGELVEFRCPSAPPLIKRAKVWWFLVGGWLCTAFFAGWGVM